MPVRIVETVHEDKRVILEEKCIESSETKTKGDVENGKTR